MKKKGSALILSILMLSFFMTITLTMYYVAKKRNQRSILKIQGTRLDSESAIGSVLTRYELYLADEYVTKGHLYNTDESGVVDYRADEYIAPIVITEYTKEMSVDGEATMVPISGSHYTGIVLNNNNEYFGAYWDPTIIEEEAAVDLDSTITDPNVLAQPWIAEDNVVSEKLISRTWLNNTGEKIVRLWTGSIGEKISIGGYRMTKLNGVDSGGAPLLAPLDPTKLSITSETIIELTYEKIVSLDKEDLGSTGIEDYRITYVEEVSVTPSGSNIIITGDSLKSMVVEKLK
jgi:hypothetical protein